MESLDTPQLNEAFALLKSPRRRYALYLLATESSSTDLSELGERIAAWETSDVEAAASGDDVETVRASLYHTHLPKLEAAGVVEYDPETGDVELVDGDRVSPFLERAARAEYSESVAADD